MATRMSGSAGPALDPPWLSCFDRERLGAFLPNDRFGAVLF